MKQAHNVKYELFDTFTDDTLQTEDRGKAIEYFRKGWIVVEHSVTMSQPTLNTVVELKMSATWNDDPDFMEV